MLPLGSVPNFFGSFCASIRARRYSEFYPLNVSLLAMLRAFGRNNFPLPKKIFRISWKRVSCIALFFLEINSIFFCRKEISLSSFGNASFLIFAKRQIFLLKETAAFFQIFLCQSSVDPSAWNLSCPRGYLEFRFREMLTSAAVFRGFASFGRER